MFIPIDTVVKLCEVHFVKKVPKHKVRIISKQYAHFQTMA